MSNKVEVVVSGVDQSGPAKKSLQDIRTELDALGGKTEEVSRKTTSATGQMNSDWVRMFGAFTAGNLVAAVIEKIVEQMMKLKEYIAESARYAARIETMGVAMHAVGNNAGYTAAQMDVYEQQVKKMGITTEASRQALTQTASAQMDVAKTAQLARVAQDAAVIGNINSSEALMRMVQGIRSGETEVLKTIGINVSFENSYKKLADSLDIASAALSENQKVQARQNSVLEYGINISGVYETSMTSTGKKITSLSRYYDELKLSFGEAFAPALGVLIDNITDKLKGLLKWAEDNKGAIAEFAQNMATIVNAGLNAVVHPIDTLGKVLISPFVGGEDDVATANEQAAVEKRYNEMMAKKAENERIQKMATARAIVEKAAKDAANKKEMDAAEGQYQQYLTLFENLKNRISDNDPFMDSFSRQIAAVDKEIEKSARTLPQYSDSIKDMGERVKTAMQENRDFKKAMEAEGHEDNADNWAKNYAAAAKAMDELNKTLAASRALELELGLARIDAEEKFYQISTGDAATRRIALLQESLQLMKEEYNLETEDNEVNKLKKLQLLEKIGKEERQIADNQKIIFDSTASGGAISALQEYARAAADIGAQTKGLVTDFLKGMEDALVNFVQHGKISFKSLIDSMIADIVRIAVRQQITGPLSGMLGGLLTAGTASASGYLPQMGDGAAIASFAPGSLGAFLSGSAAPVKKAISSGAEAGTSAGMATAAPYLAAALGAYTAVSFGAKYFGKSGEFNDHNDLQKVVIAELSLAMSGIGGIFAAAIGAATGGILVGALVGAVIVPALDKLTKGNLFGTSWKATGSGLALGVGVDGIEASNYTNFKKKKALWGGNKYSSSSSAVDELLQEYLSTQLSDIFTGIKSGSNILGGTGNLTGFTSATKQVSLTGMNAEQQQEAVAAYFKGISDEAIKSLYKNIGVYSKLGETATDTFTRLTGSLKLVNDNFTILGVPLNRLGLDGAAVADTLVQALGGLQAATTAFNNYYNSGIFTDAEQAAMKVTSAQTAVNDTFTRLGLTLPQTNEEFRTLVNSYLAQGAKGAETATELMRVAGSFAQLTAKAKELPLTITTVFDTMKNGVQDMLSIAQQNATFYKQIKDAAVSTISTLAGGDLSTLSPEAKYAQSKLDFRNASILAGQGDKSALSNLPGLGTALLQISRQYNASGAGYIGDYDSVMQSLAASAQYAGYQQTANEQIVTLAQNHVDILNKILEETKNPTANHAAFLQSQVAALGVNAENINRVTAALSAGSPIEAAISTTNNTALPNSLDLLGTEMMVGINTLVKYFATTPSALNTSVNTTTAAAPAYSPEARDSLVIALGASTLPVGAPAPFSGTWHYADGTTTKSMVGTLPSTPEEQYAYLLAYAKQYHLAGYAVGTPYVPYDQLANIHQGEIIIDPQSSAVLRKYGIPQGGAADNKKLEELLEKVLEKLKSMDDSLDTLQSKARLAAAA